MEVVEMSGQMGEAVRLGEGLLKRFWLESSGKDKLSSGFTEPAKKDSVNNLVAEEFAKRHSVATPTFHHKFLTGLTLFFLGPNHT